MPRLTSHDAMPPWCEVTFFEVVRVPAGQRHVFEPRGAKEKLIVGAGECRIACGDTEVAASAGANLDLASGDGHFEVLETLADATLVRICGAWGSELGGSGLFGVVRDDGATDKGDPVAYPKATVFDSHYHDCDEYWIVLAGRGLAVSEGISYDIGPGDCIATGMGHHHDIPQVYEPIKAVFFETTLEGARRRGHLWEHTHGPAQPQLDRI